ncbi:MAG: hypothetical protein ACN6QT_03260 [Burkholderia contaminans]|uniref:Uncharacterized protein n=2 Tax=Pseudomonadota TaxID=1224 RepID=A0AAP4R186_9BURK|nr:MULTISPECIES: hypothetical protein [Burkholderia]MBD1411972.1 hypothetical protein [Burkholderia contaminans]MBH9666800.1 hypothetical protein [Burkholderia contaminans]MBH9673653.1 hypothetical protein [Burkholderia contaminans]MBH9703697.1 hypothetical protein [Burkholderia contaminans]MBH9719845.1 hypothetical protein [Burkholderia contaminans]
MVSTANGTGSRHDSAATRDVRTHELLVAASKRARSRSGSPRERIARDQSLLRATSHYVVKRSDPAGTDTYVHKKGGGRSQTFPELWNGASGSLAGVFRIACGICGLEERLEFGGMDTPARRTAGRASSRGVVREIPP